MGTRGPKSGASMSWHPNRYEVRSVDRTRRVLVLVAAFDRFHDASLMADAARAEHGGAWVVWDAREKRELARRPPSATFDEES